MLQKKTAQDFCLIFCGSCSPKTTLFREHPTSHIAVLPTLAHPSPIFDIKNWGFCCTYELYCDNQGSIDSASSSRQSARTRHITQHDLFVRQAVLNKTEKCVKVPTADNWADFMTKPLGPDEFVRQIERLQMEPPAHVWTKPDCAKEEL